MMVMKQIEGSDTFLSRGFEPLMDWGEIREAKSRCENKCACFNQVLGCCSLGLLSSLGCKEFNMIIRERGSSSAAERLFAKVPRYHVS